MHVDIETPVRKNGNIYIAAVIAKVIQDDINVNISQKIVTAVVKSEIHQGQYMYKTF